MAPDRSTDILHLAGELGRAGEPARAFSCTEVVVDDALLRSDWDRALDVLQSFLVHGPNIPALLKLVRSPVKQGRTTSFRKHKSAWPTRTSRADEGPEAQTIAEIAPRRGHPIRRFMQPVCVALSSWLASMIPTTRFGASASGWRPGPSCPVPRQRRR